MWDLNAFEFVATTKCSNNWMPTGSEIGKGSLNYVCHNSKPTQTTQNF